MPAELKPGAPSHKYSRRGGSRPSQPPESRSSSRPSRDALSRHPRLSIRSRNLPVGPAPSEWPRAAAAWAFDVIVPVGAIRRPGGQRWMPSVVIAVLGESRTRRSVPSAVGGSPRTRPARLPHRGRLRRHRTPGHRARRRDTATSRALRLPRDTVTIRGPRLPLDLRSGPGVGSQRERSSAVRSRSCSSRSSWDPSA